MARKRMKLRDALDIVDDDMPDGAYFAMLEELTGMDSGDIAQEMAEMEEEDALDDGEEGEDEEDAE